MVLDILPARAGLVPASTPTLQGGQDVSPPLHTPTSGRALEDEVLRELGHLLDLGMEQAPVL